MCKTFDNGSFYGQRRYISIISMVGLIKLMMYSKICQWILKQVFNVCVKINGAAPLSSRNYNGVLNVFEGSLKFEQ